MIFAKTAPAWLLVKRSARESNPCISVCHILELLIGNQPIATSDRVFLSIKRRCVATPKGTALLFSVSVANPTSAENCPTH